MGDRYRNDLSKPGKQFRFQKTGKGQGSITITQLRWVAMAGRFHRVLTDPWLLTTGPWPLVDRDHEYGPVAGLAMDFDAAAVIGDDPPALRQAHPQSATRLPRRVERIEQMAALFGLDAGAVVGDANLRLPARRAAR